MQPLNLDEQMVYLDSVALNLHGFYAGVERLFELVARHIDRSELSGESWHRDLLLKMASEVNDVRPAVISQPNAHVLDEFRRFRHLVRHVYTINFDSEKIEELIVALRSAWPGLKAELMAFAHFLEALQDASGDPLA